MKISEKLSKVDEQFTVNMYDNGYMFEISGRDSDDDWATAKIMCTSMDEIAELAHEAANMERS
jgi:hypothetical protein